MYEVTLDIIMAYLEYLVQNNVLVHMIANNLSAIKASFIMHHLPHKVAEHPRINYFVKSLKINRALCLVQRNIISLQILTDMVRQCDLHRTGKIFKSIFLIAFFGFLRISNLSPTSLSTFDSSRHLTPGDVSIHKNCMKLRLKWSKTMQNRDKVHIITLPRVKGSPCAQLVHFRELQPSIPPW